jgi:hypothetical protein
VIQMSENLKREFRKRLKRLVKLKRASSPPNVELMSVNIDAGGVRIRWMHQHALTASVVFDGNWEIIFQELKLPKPHKAYNIEQMRAALSDLKRALILEELANV